MKPYTSLCFFIFLTLVLAACQPADKKPVPAPVQQEPKISDIAGNWYNDNNLFGCMTLAIDTNGNFSFYEAGCTVNRYSKGRLQRDGADIRFTSDGQYKTAAPQSMHDTASLRRMAAMNKFPAPGETLNIYLDHERYVLEKDTLYKLDRSGYKTDMKFHR